MMTFTALFRSQIRQLIAGIRPTRRPDRFRCRPAVMSLEDRAMPSVFFNPVFGNEAQRQDGGAVLPSPPVYLIFWGSWWGGTNSFQADVIKAVAANVLNSPYLRGLSPQYHTDGLAQLNSLAAYDSSNPADLGFGGKQIDDVIQNQIDNGPLPESDDGPHTPIYVVVTPPGIRSNQGRTTSGFNQLGHDYDFPSDYDDIPEVWAWTGNNGDGTINLDQFTLTLGHEVAEIMSDLGGGGFEVNPGPKWAAGGSGNQIGDYEGNSYQYREANGALVQPFWSAHDNKWLAADSNSQAVFLDPQWNWNGMSCGPNNCSYTGRNALTINGHSPMDTIAIDTNGGGVRVTWNGEVFQFDPGQISSIVVNTGNGNDTVTIGSTLSGVGVTVNLGSGTDTVNVGGSDLGNLQGNVTINPGLGFDTLNVNDFFGRGSHSYFLTSNTVRRSDTAVITYTGINSVNVNGNLSGNNVYNVNGTEAGFTTILSTGNGADVVNVESTNAGIFAVNEGSGGVTVNISPTARTLNNIQGTLNIEGASSGTDNLVIDDRATSAAQALTYTLNAFSFSRVARSGTINTNNRISNVILFGSGGNNTYNVTGTGALTLTTLNTGAGNDTVNVEAAARPLTINVQGTGTNVMNMSPVGQNLDNISAAVHVSGSGGNATLNIDDQRKTTQRLFGIGPNIVAYSGGVGIFFNNMAGVVVNGGGGNNTYTVTGTVTSSRTTINTGTGTDMVNVEAVNQFASLNVNEGGSAGISVNISPTAENLNNIQGTVTVTGNSSQSDALTLHDDNNNTAQTYTLTAGSISRTGMAGRVTYSSFSGFVYVNAYGVSAGSIVNVGGTVPHSMTNVGTVAGNIRVNIEAVGPMSSVSIYGNRSGNVVNISPVAHNLINIRGAVSINNAVGSVQLNVNDAADLDSHPNALLSLNGLTGLAPAAISFDPSLVNNLTINDGQGNDVYTVTGCPSTTVLNAGPGADAINVQGLQAFRHLTLNTSVGSRADTITLGDASQTLSGIDGMQSSITLNAKPGDALVVNDQGYANVRNYYLTPTTLTWTFGPRVSYSGLSWTTLNGSQGNDTFDLSAGTAVSNGVVLDGGGGNNTLIGSTSGNTWLITGPAPDTGYLQGPAYGGSVSFYQIGNLTGGSGGDIFQFFDQAALSGNLAGSGNTTLDYSPYSTSVIVDLQNGFATGVGGSVSGVVNVIGGSAAPGTPGLYNLLIGTGGNTLTGGTGRRNILVASGSASTLIAGDTEDLLIGGSTIYDNDPTDPNLQNWQAIAAYWAGTDDYFTRAANLTSGNGVPLLDATTVTGNGGGNTLTGNGALALIYSDGNDNITSFDPNSIILLITP